MTFDESPLIINLCPTGIIPTKAATPHVPVEAGEIIDTVLECADLGISMAHLHARNPDQSASSAAEDYAPILEGIRSDTRGKDLVLCVTTSGRRVTDPAGRASVLQLEGSAKPDMASLTLSSLNFLKEASVNAPDTIRYLASEMQSKGIKPELEVFDLGMVNFAHVLIKEGLIKPPYYFNILLGNIATAQASLLHLGSLISSLPEGSIYSIAGVGRFQKPMNTVGLAMAHGVRVGLEDNIFLTHAPQKEPASNQQLTARIVALANTLGRPIESPSALRVRLGLG